MPATPLRVKIHLGTMMFLQFAINGIWSIPLVTCLTQRGYSESDTALVYTTFAWGAIVAPLFVGMIADRFFASEKILAVLNLSGGVLLGLSTLVIADPRMFFWALLAHCLCYFPTWSLTNSIALAHVRNPDREFPIIRLMGTIGWIAVSAISAVTLVASHYQWNIEETVWPLWIGAGLAIVTGIYNFFLPHTPPPAAGKKASLGELLGLPALALLRDRNFAVLTFASLLIMLPASLYWTWANDFLNEIGMQSAQFKQSIGQMTEVLFIFLLPVFFLRYLSVKSIFFLGLAAWAARFALLASSTTENAAVYAALLLHGACFAFIFVLGPMYVDRKAPKELQASAQGLLTLATFGVGSLLGTYLSGPFLEHYKRAEPIGKILHDWGMFWFWAAVMSAALAVVFAALFSSRDDAPPNAVVGKPDETQVVRSQLE